MVLKKILFTIIRKFIKEKEKYIRAEAIVIDDEWNSLKKFFRKEHVWYVITPANYDYCKCVFNLKIDKNRFTSILKERINILEKNKQEIQLLMFLGKHTQFLTNELQNSLFQEAIEFMNSINISPKKLLVIDEIYDKYTIELARNYGISEVFDSKIYLFKPLLKIVKKLGIKLTFIQHIFESFKVRDFRSVFYLILGEFMEVKEKTIHIECLIRDEIWEIIKKKLVGKNWIWYIITPANFDYFKIYFNMEIEKNKFIDILKSRLNYLKENKEEIQLHIHFSKRRDSLDFHLQESKFKESIEFMNSIGIYPNKFAAGWWIFNKNTIKLAKKYGLKEISAYSINPLLRYMKIYGIMIKFVHKYWHDYEFL
jgi:hypothetical protein